MIEGDYQVDCMDLVRDQLLCSECLSSCLFQKRRLRYMLQINTAWQLAFQYVVQSADSKAGPSSMCSIHLILYTDSKPKKGGTCMFITILMLSTESSDICCTLMQTHPSQKHAKFGMTRHWLRRQQGIWPSKPQAIDDCKGQKLPMTLRQLPPTLGEIQWQHSSQ